MCRDENLRGGLNGRIGAYGCGSLDCKHFMSSYKILEYIFHVMGNTSHLASLYT